jgi:hypothetical protein
VGIRTLATAGLDIPDLVRPVGIIHRRQKPLTPTASRFVELLTEAVRQYRVMAEPMQLLCKPDCLGLCPHCGYNLNQGPCGCPRQDVDERWSALTELAEKLSRE